MTVTFLPGNKLTGLSSDDKPTWVIPGSTFTETDTGVQFGWDGTTWVTSSAGGFVNATIADTGTLNILLGRGVMTAGNTPYNNTVPIVPTTGSSYIAIGQVIVIASFTGTASSAGDTVEVLLNGSVVSTQSIAAGLGWGADVDQIAPSPSGSINVQLIVTPTDGVSTDGIIDSNPVTGYPGNFLFIYTSLTAGDYVGVAILGNASIPGSPLYDFQWQATGNLVTTDQWNNTDPQSIHTFVSGNVNLFLQAIGGATNLYPTSIIAYYVVGTP